MLGKVAACKDRIVRRTSALGRVNFVTLESQEETEVSLDFGA
jgi:hypothetical protein